jgi:hypothetical protein
MEMLRRFRAAGGNLVSPWTQSILPGTRKLNAVGDDIQMNLATRNDTAIEH